jgi:hypothetical protein
MDLSRNRRAGGPGNPSRRKGHVHRSRRSVPPRQQGATSTSDTLPKRMGTVHPCRPVKYETRLARWKADTYMLRWRVVGIDTSSRPWVGHFTADEIQIYLHRMDRMGRRH